MRKATTIIRLIDNLERELYSNYSDEQIQTAIQKERKVCEFLEISDGLVNIIDSATRKEKE